MSAGKPVNYLVADIGGTNTRLAVVDDNYSITQVEGFENSAYADLSRVIETYLTQLPAKLQPKAAVFAVACPVDGDIIRFTNREWEFSVSAISKRFAFDGLEVLNDFAALSLAVPGLGKDDLVGIGAGRAVPGKPVAIIGPGTGLGVAILVPVDGRWIPVSTEGGHVTLAAFSQEEADLIAQVRARIGHVSAERLVSGPGLSHIYQALAGIEDERDVPDAATISTHGLDSSDAVASQTLDIFMAMLGTVAGNLALTTGAQGGVYIGGGILPRMVSRFLSSGFRSRFIDKGRYRDYLDAVPTWLITREHVALIGLRDYLQRSGVCP